MKTIAIGPMILIAAVVLLALLIGKKKTRRVGIYVGVGIVVFGLLAMLFMANTYVAIEEDRQQTKVPTQSTPGQFDEVMPMRSYSAVDPVWDVTVENEFEADVYPSIETAAQALGKKAALRLTNVTANQEPATEVLVCIPEKFRYQLGDDIREGIIRVKPMPNIRVLSNRIPSEKWPHKLNPQAVTLNLAWNLSEAKPSWRNTKRKYWEGTLEINAIGQGGEFREEIQFIDKPWVSDFSGFANRQPQENWLIAQSQRPCTSAEEAHQQAITDAVDKLTQRIYPDVIQYSNGKLIRGSKPSYQQVQRVVESELRRSYTNLHVYRQKTRADGTPYYPGKYIRDRFVQRFERDYGDLWREAMLVDASGYNLERLAKLYARGLRSNRQSWFAMILSAMGMLVLVCVVYVFLNAATKGYYKAALRVAAVVLVIAILVIVMVLT